MIQFTKKNGNKFYYFHKDEFHEIIAGGNFDITTMTVIFQFESFTTQIHPELLFRTIPPYYEGKIIKYN